MEKHITTKPLSKGDLEYKFQAHSKNQRTMTLETKNMQRSTTRSCATSSLIKTPSYFGQIVEKHITTKPLSKGDLEYKFQAHSKNQRTMTLETKNMPSKKFELMGPLVIGVMPTRTMVPTAVKQYIERGGRHYKNNV